jgi:hypothetical protein
MRKGRYYLGRVIKAGNLDQRRLMDAIVNSASVTIGKSTWTVADVLDKRNASPGFVFGKLSKFSADGQVKVVDTKTKSQVDASAENLLLASSPFVYLPEFSGIAFLHVWNQIQEDIFPRRFKSIVEETYQRFFVDCTIEPISDYRAFSLKLKEFDVIHEMSAKVHPPNPLFGRLWEPLKDYLVKRNASEVSVREAREDGKGLKTSIVELIDAILENPKHSPSEPPDITDAAMLMAADGYGLGKVSGQKGNDSFDIRTSDTKKSFLSSKEPEPETLAAEAHDAFSKISKERDLSH